MKLVRVINPKFQSALMKLSEQDLPIASAKKVLEALRIIKEISEKYESNRVTFIGGLADKNEDGTPKSDDKGNFVLSEENREKVNERLREMMDQDIELPRIPESDLSEARLSAQEYSLLEGLFS